jgi:hypothetical protein
VTHFDAWKMTWKLDPLGFDAYADWLEENRSNHEELLKDAAINQHLDWLNAMAKGSACWRRRAEVARAVLAWIAEYQEKFASGEEIVWLPTTVKLLPGWRLHANIHRKTVSFILISEHLLPMSQRAADIIESPATVFPLNKLADEVYLRRRLIDLADRIGNLMEEEKSHA